MCRATYVTPYGTQFCLRVIRLLFSSKRYCLQTYGTRTLPVCQYQDFSFFLRTLSLIKYARTTYSLPVLYVVYFILLLILFVCSGTVVLQLLLHFVRYGTSMPTISNNVNNEVTIMMIPLLMIPISI